MTLPHRLLIVDDEEAILFAMGDFLVRSGYLVDRASSREQAERLLDNGEPYALAIVDLRLSATDPRGGLELLRRIRRSSPQTRTILLTAYGSPEVDATMPAITNIEVAPDGRRVRLVIDKLQEGHIHELHATGVRSAAGQPLLHPQAYYTLNYIPDP